MKLSLLTFALLCLATFPSVQAQETAEPPVPPKTPLKKTNASRLPEKVQSALDSSYKLDDLSIKNYLKVVRIRPTEQAAFCPFGLPQSSKGVIVATLDIPDSPTQEIQKAPLQTVVDSLSIQAIMPEIGRAHV